MVSVDGLIEDDGLHMRQADFANEYIGGGALATVDIAGSEQAKRVRPTHCGGCP